MTLPLNDRIVGPYLCTGGETVFGYDFRLFSAGDLAVERSRDGVIQRLFLDIDYTVTDVDNVDGGNVLLTTAAEGGDSYTLIGARPASRITNFSTHGGITGPQLNAEYDRIFALLQELAREIGRSIRLRMPSDDLAISGRNVVLTLDDEGNLDLVPKSELAGGGSGGGIDLDNPELLQLIQEQIGTKLLEGSNITIGYNALTGETTIASTASGSGGGSGGGGATVAALNWRKVMAGGETVLSGNDDASVLLTYTAGTESVYLNGVRLVAGLDYVTTSPTVITISGTALTAEDVAVVFVSASGSGGGGAGDMLGANNLSDVANATLSFDNLNVRGADIASASTINLTTATGNLVDVTGTTTITAVTLADGLERTVRFTGALTLTHGASLTLPGEANITTAAGDFAIFRGYAAGVVRCVAYTRANGTPIAGGGGGGGGGSTSAVELTTTVPAFGMDYPINLGLSLSVVSNALVIAIKGANGSDASSVNPVLMPFRSPTLTTGTPVIRSLQAASSLTLSSGSTAGVTANKAFRLWFVMFDDGGVLRPGVINCADASTIYALPSIGVASSTAEGGAGAADSAGVFYTGTAVTSKAFRVLGCAAWETGLATPGTWVAPTTLHLAGPHLPMPGTVLQAASITQGAGSNTTSATLVDVTGATLSFGLWSAANRVRFSYDANVTVSAAGAGANSNYVGQFLRDAVVLGSYNTGVVSGAGTNFQTQGHAASRGLDFPNSVSALTYKAQHRRSSTASCTATTAGVNMLLEEIMT